MSNTLKDMFLKNLKTDKVQIDHFDAAETGLSIRVTKAGKKTWTFWYKSPRDSSRARISLGTYPATSLDDARARARATRKLVEAGTDPRDIVPEETPKTMAELCRERLEMRVVGKLRTADEVEYRYNKYIIPAVGDVFVRDFRIDPHYNKVIDPLVKRGKLRTAGVIHTDLATLMAFAINRGVIEYSRIVAAESPDPRNIRTRSLSSPEIVTVWTMLPELVRNSRSFVRILKLCLILGQRLSEVAGILHHEEVDLGKKIWTIPAERVKNGFAHVVPLPNIAVAIIREAMQETNSIYLFPNRGGEQPLTAAAVGVTLDRIREKFGIPHWTVHDLRRTVGTQMLNKENGLGIPKFDKYLVLNHRSATKGNVSDEVYDQNEYLDEKREALDRWGAFLAKLVGEDIELREAA